MGKRIRGHSHVPAPMKGVYQVGGTVTGRMSYNQGPAVWSTPRPFVSNAVIQAAAAEQMMRDMTMLKEFFGESMCGDCISTKLTGGHDRNSDKRRTCQLCGTVWSGLEPENERRKAIMEQRKRKHGE